ncbi:MAG: response regulator [Bacteroidales bacterium]|nr:response regulator [Bacteroidales bacterium]HPD95237.1 response regulator [Tenuifilaceae bacterium]
MQSKPTLDLTGKRVLVVEDDTVSRIFLREVLLSTNADVNFVRSGYEANKFMTENSAPHLVFMDVRLPDIDGIDLAEEIIRKNPEVKVIVETAYAIPGIKERCEEKGIHGLIYKPINQEQLISLIQNLV